MESRGGRGDSPPPRAHLPPAALPSAPAALSLAQHGGFLSALPLVAEFLVGSDGPLSSLRLGHPIQEYDYVRRQDEQIFLDAGERALAVERARYMSLLRLRLVAKSWRDSATGYDRKLRTVSTAPPGHVVPFPFRCLRKLELDLFGVRDSNWYEVLEVLELPSWFGDLALEELHATDPNFRVPVLPALSQLRRVSSNWTDFIPSVEGIRDRPLEYIDFSWAPWSGEHRLEMYDAVSRAFDGTVCGQTLRELRFSGQALEQLPDGLCNLRLTALDISETPVRELPEWLGNHPLIVLQLTHSSIESLPRSLRSCQTLRLLGLGNTALGTATYRHLGEADGQLLYSAIRVPGNPHVINHTLPDDVSGFEIQRRTGELMEISLALPDLRIDFSYGAAKLRASENTLWHARCGKPWTDPVFYVRQIVGPGPLTLV